MKRLFITAIAYCLTQVWAFAQTYQGPVNYTQLPNGLATQSLGLGRVVVASSITGYAYDGCDASTGLNSSNAACGDYGALVNAQLASCVSIYMDVGIGTSVQIKVPKSCSAAIFGPVLQNVGIFALPAFGNTNGGGPLVSNSYAYTAAATAPTPTGSVWISGITINGNSYAMPDAVCGLNGSNPCIDIYLANLAHVYVDHCYVVNAGSKEQGAFALYFANNTENHIFADSVVGNSNAMGVSAGTNTSLERTDVPTVGSTLFAAGPFIENGRSSAVWPLTCTTACQTPGSVAGSLLAIGSP